MNEAQFFIISLLIGVLIVISIMQTLVTAFLERMGEFGTLEEVFSQYLNQKGIGDIAIGRIQIKK